MAHHGGIYEYGLAMTTTLTGLAWAFWPGIARENAVLRHEEALADRLSRGSDSYFEELRTLNAYQPNRSIRSRRLWGVLFAFSGIAFFILLVIA